MNHPLGPVRALRTCGFILRPALALHGVGGHFFGSAPAGALLVGGLAGCGLGSYLLVKPLGSCRRKAIYNRGLGVVGLSVALGTFFFYVNRGSRDGGERFRKCGGERENQA